MRFREQGFVKRLPAACFAAVLSLVSPFAAFALPSDSGLPVSASATSGLQVTGAVVAMPLSRNDFLTLFRDETDPDTCGPGAVVVHIVHTVKNDADSAVHGLSWANDTYGRYVTIVEVVAPVAPQTPGTYCVVTRYTGSFTSDGVKSPGDSVVGLVAGVRGTFSGGYRSVPFTGVLKSLPLRPTSGNLGITDYGCNPLTDVGDHKTCSGLFSILATYFDSPAPDVGFDLAWWGWRYVTSHNGDWQNACDGPDPDCPGTTGDITN